MSDKQNIDKRLSDAKSTLRGLLKTHKSADPNSDIIEVVKQRSPKDMALWVVAVLLLLIATLVGRYLPRYWAMASENWVQLTVIALLSILALLCLYMTHQGAAFKTLLKDAGVELRRITWPSKNETTTYTWQVLVVMVIVGIFVWVVDNMFTRIIGWIL